MEFLTCLKKIGLALFVLLLSLQATSQMQAPQVNDFVVFEATVEFIDSQYVLIPKIRVTSKGKTIQIPQEIYYTPGYASGKGDYEFYIQKLVRGRQLNIFTDYFSTLGYSKGKPKYRNFGYSDALADTINLQRYYPFEIGKYRVKLQFFCYYKKNIYLLETEWVEFDVSAEPVKEFGNIKGLDE